MAQRLSFTLSKDSIIVIYKNKPVTVRATAPNFLSLKQSLMRAELSGRAEDWNEVEKNMTPESSARNWTKGRFTIKEGKAFFDNVEVPESLGNRIAAMASRNEDPMPLFKFWERLQKNPSYRSIHQLFPFLEHAGIPLLKDGCFHAYKSVQSNFRDHHSGQYDNSPGRTNEMPRNQVSDDPEVACHEGFHVGALNYANSFGSDRRIVICKVAPEDVVSVPRDCNSEKMRVCKYTVIGLHGGEQMSSTTYDEPEESSPSPEPLPYQPPRERTKAKSAAPKRIPKKAFEKYEKMSAGKLMECSLDELRQYAGKGLDIVGASKVPGGKTALVAKILSARAS